MAVDELAFAWVAELAMTGMKFGSSGNPSLTWAMNAYVAGMISQRYARSRIVAFLTGDSGDAGPVSPEDRESLAPPDDAVKREMLDEWAATRRAPKHSKARRSMARAPSVTNP